MKRPDKEENIRIEALPAGPQGEASEKGADKSSDNRKAYEGRASQNDKPRFERRPKPHGKPSDEAAPKFDGKPSPDKQQRKKHRPAHGGQPARDRAPFAKPAFGKKPDKNKFRP